MGFPFFYDHELPPYPFGHPNCSFCRPYQPQRPFPHPAYCGHRSYYGRPWCPVDCTGFLVGRRPPFVDIVYSYPGYNIHHPRALDVVFLYPGPRSPHSPHPHLVSPYLPGDLPEVYHDHPPLVEKLQKKKSGHTHLSSSTHGHTHLSSSTHGHTHLSSSSDSDDDGHDTKHQHHHRDTKHQHHHRDTKHQHHHRDTKHQHQHRDTKHQHQHRDKKSGQESSSSSSTKHQHQHPGQESSQHQHRDYRKPEPSAPPFIQPTPEFVGRERPIDRERINFRMACRRGQYNGFAFLNAGRVLKDVENHRPNSEVLNYLQSNESNVYLKDWITKTLQNMIHSEDGIQIWAPQPPRIRKVVVDFLSPEIAKDLHLGHFRSAVLADSIARLLEFSGVRVVRRNSIGAWGSRFGLLLEFLLSGFPDLNEEHFVGLAVQDVYGNADEQVRNDIKPIAGAFYSEGYSLQFLDAWPLVYQFSYKEFRKTYENLEVYLEKEEEHVHLHLLAVQFHLIQNDLMASEDKNMYLIQEDGSCLDLTVEMRRGFNNLLTDLTALWYRLNVEKAEWIIYITTPKHHEHLEMVSKVAKRRKWLQEDSQGPYNLDKYPKVSQVTVGPGSSFHICTAEAVRLDDILDGAKTACQAYLRECGKARDVLDINWLKENASALANGAAKYAYLKNNECRNEKSVLVELLKDMGNNVIYVLHAYQQICSMIWSYQNNMDSMNNYVLDDTLECELGLQLLRFSETVNKACTSLSPSVLCNYLGNLVEISVRFSAAYKEIGGTKEEISRRLMLCSATFFVMTKCFDLIGIPRYMMPIQVEYIRKGEA